MDGKLLTAGMAGCGIYIYILLFFSHMFMTWCVYEIFYGLDKKIVANDKENGCRCKDYGYHLRYTHDLRSYLLAVRERLQEFYTD